jgi:cytochrome c-type biogenesis protein CcmE
MTPTRKKRLSIVLLVLFAASMAVALVSYAFKENIDVYFSPQSIANGEAPLQRMIRVGGIVVDDSVSRDNDTLKVSFSVTDGEADLKIHFQGILPDLFREGQGIVARGQLQQDGSFTADEVLAKHDETYTPPEVSASLAGNLKYDQEKAALDAAENTKPIAGGSLQTIE